MSRVLYFHTGSSSFVDKDVKILQESAEVLVFPFTVGKKWMTPIVFIRQFLFLVTHTLRCSMMVSQFAGYHSFLPGLFCRMTGNKLLIISGGTDCVSFPNIRYGNFFRPVLRVFTGWSYRLCHHISPKHDTLISCDYTYDAGSPQKQGILAFMPTLKKPFTTIPNGYDCDFWSTDGSKRLPRSFITVSSGLAYPFQTKLKGIDLIIKIAKEFPACTFTIVGVPDGLRIPIESENIRLLPPASRTELRRLYSGHIYYLQLSMAEGFPNALSEAMACGCVPVGSAVFSIPEIIDGNGLILERRDLYELGKVVSKALTLDAEAVGKKASESIRKRFPIQRRRQELLALVDRLKTCQ